MRDWSEVAGVEWHPEGHCLLTGAALELFDAIDAALRRWGRRWPVVESAPPPALGLAELQRVDYLRSFPHLVTFPACLARDHLEEFAREPKLGEDQALHLEAIEPVSSVLTPAACLHLYVQHRGQDLPEPSFRSVRTVCFRREERFQPLIRQWAFTMREVVCFGARASVEAFLHDARARATRLLDDLGIKHTWRVATDPFFRRSEDPRHLMQRIAPSKWEAVGPQEVALCSLNVHREHFTGAFDISAGGAAAESACVAFGIERWLHALLSVYGVHAADWRSARQILERDLAE